MYHLGDRAKSVKATFVLPIVITSVTPSVVHPGQTAKVAVAATGILKGATLQVSGSGVTVSSTKASTSKLKATLTVSSTATLGTRDITVTNKNGLMGICTGCLTVYEPTISSLSPNSLPAGSSKGRRGPDRLGIHLQSEGHGVGHRFVGQGHGDGQLPPGPFRIGGQRDPPSNRDVTVTNKDGASVTAVAALSTT